MPPAPCTSPPPALPARSTCAATTPSSSTPGWPTSKSPSPGVGAAPCASGSRHANQLARDNLNSITAPGIEVSCDAVALPVPDWHQARLGPEYGDEKPQLAFGKRQSLDFRLPREGAASR